MTIQEQIKECGQRIQAILDEYGFTMRIAQTVEIVPPDNAIISSESLPPETETPAISDLIDARN